MTRENMAARQRLSRARKAVRREDGMTEQESTREERAASIAEVRHSTALEGRRSTDAARALQDRYIDGEFGVDELVRRGQRLYGLPPQPGDMVMDDEKGTVPIGDVLPGALVCGPPGVRLTAGDVDEVQRFRAYLEDGGASKDPATHLAALRKHYPDEPEPAS
ncbi:antitoxin VbhA family protein [Kribbella sp. NPDC056345]|uniref:antitoxin VbhA family protein n=1 Tax=Kribbella sp. NPDC056345 TaxID=3345789 RepID=UPI0035E23D8C